MHFQDTHASLSITIAKKDKRARLKVEEGVRLSLEAIWRAEEEQSGLEDEEKEYIVEEARMESEEEEQARLRAGKETRISKEARQKS